MLETVNREVTVSYYGGNFHGRVTASGEIFDKTRHTCASPNLPFETFLLLKREDRSLWVRVNDRGPFAVDSEGKAIRPLQPHPVRELDLSEAAFNYLFNGLELGVGKVKIIKMTVKR